MKNRKKMTACMAVLFAAGSMIMPVEAAGTTQTGSTEITSTVNSHFTLTIPMRTEIPFETESTPIAVQVIGNVKQGETVVVTTQEGALANKKGNGEIPYTLDVNEHTWSEAELRSAAPTVKSVNLKLTPESWDQAQAGEYQGTLMFTANLQ